MNAVESILRVNVLIRAKGKEKAKVRDPHKDQHLHMHDLTDPLELATDLHHFTHEPFYDFLRRGATPTHCERWGRGKFSLLLG